MDLSPLSPPPRRFVYRLDAVLSILAVLGLGAGCSDATDGDGSPPDSHIDGDAGMGAGSDDDICALRSDAILALAENTITVSPAADGLVSVGGDTRTLRQVISSAAEGDTILLADGTYGFPANTGGGYTGLYFTTPNVTLRSASGDPNSVVLDSAYGDHGNGSAPITVAAPGVVLADFTVRRSVFHLIHLWADGDDAIIHNVRLEDGGQQFLKASPGSSDHVDGVEVSCSEFHMTESGRDNVWGYGATDGGTRCYTGGIDTHNARNWDVHDNSFEGIYCNAGGVRRPAHGQSPEERDGRTYRGGLAEHAIHMWDSPAGSGHSIDRNSIVNCARGIGLGLRDEVYGTAIRNNMIFSEHAGGSEHDVGIIVERAHDTQILNNTVFFSSASAYPNGIEYRWPSTSGLEIRNNLTNKQIRRRNEAVAQLSANVVDASASWFVDASVGDLHLAICDEPTVVGAGDVVGTVDVDFDGEPRGSANDIGADHCSDE